MLGALITLTVTLTQIGITIPHEKNNLTEASLLALLQQVLKPNALERSDQKAES
jgi:hypothetical protein